MCTCAGAPFLCTHGYVCKYTPGTLIYVHTVTAGRCVHIPYVHTWVFTHVRILCVHVWTHIKTYNRAHRCAIPHVHVNTFNHTYAFSVT